MSQTYLRLSQNRVVASAKVATIERSGTRAAWQSIVILILHIPLALIMLQTETAATIHAYVVLALGLLWALQRRIEHVVWITAYIVGAEVLWRMTSADVFWEFGKYALSFILLIAIIRTTQQSPPVLALLYFLLLIPAAWMTAFIHPFSEARQMISFNLSGPFALTVCIWFFQQCVILKREHLVRLAFMLTAPIVGIATVAAYNLFTARNVRFTLESNFVTSGGFGPNQVSAMLGLGIVGCTLALAFSKQRLIRFVLVVTIGFLLVQSALTFSRTGIALTIVGLVFFVPFMVRTGRQRLAVLALSAIAFVFVQLWMIPALNKFTNGMFMGRYTQYNLTHRDELIMMDLQIWNEHFVFGVGAGGAVDARAILGLRVVAHTEYTRMLAEHGLFGLVALLALLAMGLGPILRRQHASERGVHSALIFWAFAFMVVSGFRLAAPAFLLGLCWAPLYLEAQLLLIQQETFS